MIDPSRPLASFQKALTRGVIALHPCPVDPTLWVHYDQGEDGARRITYARLQGGKVTAFVMVAQAEPYQGLHCFAVGYATPKEYQGRGHAKEILRAAINEMKHMSREFGVKAFYLDACVSIKNVASQRVVERVFGVTGKPCREALSGESALQYYLKITTD